MANDNITTVRQFIDELWNNGNFDVIDDYIAPAHVLHDPLTTELRGPDSYEQHVRALRGAFPDMQFVVEEVFGSGDVVCSRWLVRGTHKGDLFGIAPTNRRAVLGGATIVHFKAGKIIETWHCWDALSLLQQVGVIGTLDKLIRAVALPAARPH